MLRLYTWSPRLLYALCALVFIYLVFPLFVVIPISFNAGEGLSFPPTTYSLRWYENYLGDPAWIDATLTSVKVATLTAVLSTGLGTLAAIGLARGRLPVRTGLYAFVLSPMVVPVIVLAVGFYRFFSTIGLVGSILGLAIAHTVIAAPFVVLTVTATLARFDVQLEQASASLGAGPFRTFFLVTLPLIRPAVLTGALFAFMTSFDEVVIALFLGSASVATLPKMMWASMRSGIDPTIAAVSLLLIGLSLLVLTCAGFLRRHTELAFGGDER